MYMKKHVAVTSCCFIVFCFLVSCLMGCSKSESTENMSQTKQEINVEASKKMEEAKKLVIEGRDLNNKGKYEEAIRKLLQAKEITNVSVCSYYLAIAYYNKGENEKASEYFDEVIRQYQSLNQDGTSRYFLQFSYIYKMHIAMDKKAYDEAVRNCEKAIYYTDTESDKGALTMMKAHLQKYIHKQI